jgi:hypothetical protein
MMMMIESNKVSVGIYFVAEPLSVVIGQVMNEGN